MKKDLTPAQKAMRKLGAIGGKANIRKYGKGHMSKILKDYWNSPAGQARRKKGRNYKKH